MAQVQFSAFENLTVSTTGLALTAATYGQADYAHVYVDVADVRLRLDATVPTASVGIPLTVGDEVLLESRDEVVRARFIRDGGTDAILQVSYGVKI